MKYCPQCEAEYQDWVSHCADCHKLLVGELPKKDLQEMGSDVQGVRGCRECDSELVCVKVFLNEQEADIVRGLLESNGISTMLVPDSDPSREGLRFSKGNQIWVRKEDVKAAVELLSNPAA